MLILRVELPVRSRATLRMAAGGVLLPSAKGAFSGRGPSATDWGRSPEKAEPAEPQGAGFWHRPVARVDGHLPISRWLQNYIVG